jgi:hypothetical protein
MNFVQPSRHSSVHTQGVVPKVRYVLKGQLTNLTLQPIPVAHIPRVLPLKVLRQVPGLAKDLISFSPKRRKQIVGRFFLNTDSVAAFNARFSASTAAACGSISLTGVGLACLVDASRDMLWLFAY